MLSNFPTFTTMILELQPVALSDGLMDHDVYFSISSQVQHKLLLI